eukprot:COSAG05_NODE_474_length_9484_cov_8.277784_6_plen_193_part_00
MRECYRGLNAWDLVYRVRVLPRRRISMFGGLSIKDALKHKQERETEAGGGGSGSPGGGDKTMKGKGVRVQFVDSAVIDEGGNTEAGHSSGGGGELARMQSSPATMQSSASQQGGERASNNGSEWGGGREGSSREGSSQEAALGGLRDELALQQQAHELYLLRPIALSTSHTNAHNLDLQTRCHRSHWNLPQE